MSRNLCVSKCCENIVTLSDIRGKPIEFRRYAKAINIGTKWACPTCETNYFVIWRDQSWDPLNFQMGNFVLDLSYYESFNDEHSDRSLENPAYLCTDNAEDLQTVW